MVKHSEHDLPDGAVAASEDEASPALTARHEAGRGGVAKPDLGHYLRDRVVLLLLSANAFLTLLASLLIIFRLKAGSTSGGFIVQYRPSLGVSAFKTGSQLALIGFIIFVLFVFGFHLVLSMRTYAIRRAYALAVLALGTLLLAIAILVSNALLALH